MEKVDYECPLVGVLVMPLGDGRLGEMPPPAQVGAS